MDLKKVEKLLQLMQKYKLQKLELKSDNDEIKLVQNEVVQNTAPQLAFAQPQTAEASPSPQLPSSNSNYKEIKSPFVGTFYISPSPGADPFVQVGKKIKKGDTLCIVEAMKLMNEIESEVDGEITEVLVENEQPVEFNQPLFRYK